MRGSIGKQLLGLTACACLLAGCRSDASMSEPHRLYTTPQAQPSELIFHPDWTNLATVDVPRAPWPSTIAAPAHRESLEYTERFLDSYNPRDHGFGNHISSQFRSVRRGRINR